MDRWFSFGAAADPSAPQYDDRGSFTPLICIKQRHMWWVHMPSVVWFPSGVKAAVGTVTTQRPIHARQMSDLLPACPLPQVGRGSPAPEPRYWTNPLETALPIAPNLTIYCLYGVGLETDPSLRFPQSGDAGGGRGGGPKGTEGWPERAYYYAVDPSAGPNGSQFVIDKDWDRDAAWGPPCVASLSQRGIYFGRCLRVGSG